MRRILFIVNPNAGTCSLEEFKETLEQTLQTLEPEHPDDISTEILARNSPEMLRASLRNRLLTDPVDILAVVGGDGTIMEVLPIMVDFPKVKLALIPYGTGNLLAVNLGIPKDFEQSLSVLLKGTARQIDLGCINGQYYFALLAGVGTVAEIMENTPSEHKQRFGMWAYLLDGLKTIWHTPRARFKLTTSDGQIRQGKGVAVVVSNAASVMQPCVALTPQATPDDGLLDVSFLKAKGRKDYLPIIFKLLRRPDPNTFEENIEYFQTKKIRIESKPRLKVQADGNIIGRTPIDVEILPGKLQIMVPAETVEPAASLETQEQPHPAVFQSY